MHGQSMVSVYREIGMSLLPDEYLPDDYDGPSAGTLEDITGEYIYNISNLLSLNHANYIFRNLKTQQLKLMSAFDIDTG